MSLKRVPGKSLKSCENTSAKAFCQLVNTEAQNCNWVKEVSMHIVTPLGQILCVFSILNVIHYGTTYIHGTMGIVSRLLRLCSNVEFRIDYAFFLIWNPCEYMGRLSKK